MKHEVMSWNKFDKTCIKLVDHIKKNKSSVEIKSIYGIPRGGLCIAVRLSHLLNLPLVLKPNKNSLVVDDVADSGTTLMKYNNYLTATLYYKVISKIIPTFFILTTNKWIDFPWELK